MATTKKPAAATQNYSGISVLTLDPILERALAEDIGTGDITTDSVIPPSTHISGQLLAKEDGCVCGLPVFCRVFALLDPDVKVELVADEIGRAHV